jgi:hypothetical protein
MLSSPTYTKDRALSAADTLTGLGGAPVFRPLVSTGASDNGGAINTQITAANSSQGNPQGGLIEIPRGTYTFSTPIGGPDLRNITLRGAGGPGAGGNDKGATHLIYTGTGARALDFRSAGGCRIENLEISYNDDFTGRLIDFSHAPSGADAHYNTVEHCALRANFNGVPTAACAISFDGAITCFVRYCKIGQFLTGIRGGEKIGPSNVNYSNAIGIHDNEFDSNPNGHILNISQLWTITGNTFELLDIFSTGPTLYVVTGDIDTSDGTEYGSTFTFIGNWVGDVGITNVAGIHQPVRNDWSGVYIAGNVMTCGGVPCIKLDGKGNGITIVGNSLSSNTSGGYNGAPIKLGDASISNELKQGVLIFGNDFSLSAIQAGTNAVDQMAGHLQLCVFGNRGFSGKCDEQLTLNGQFITSTNHNSPADSAGTLYAGAGSGASLTVRGNTIAGYLILTTGTTPSGTTLFDVNYGRPFSSLIPSQHPLPKVLLTPAKANTVGLGSFVRNEANTVSLFRVECNTTPSAGTTYEWYYFVYW